MTKMNKLEKTGITTLPGLLTSGAKLHTDHTALAYANGFSYTYREADRLTTQVARQFYGAGLVKGDRIAIISENNPHWGIAYFGIQRAGGVAVPILTDFREKEMRSILEHAGVRAVVISAKQHEKFTNGFPPSVQYLMSVEDFTLVSAEDPRGRHALHAKKQPGKITPEEGDPVAFPEVSGDDLAAIIYTSGTTGRSKGVMLTHMNMLHNAQQSGHIHQILDTDVFLSVLPLAHTYECTIGLMVPLLNGASVHYVDRAPTASYLAPLLQKLQPTTMLTVPLIIEKIYRSRIKPQLQKSPVTRLMTRFGPTRKLVHRAAGKKLMAFFGGKIRFYGIGGAPLAPEVEKFLIEARFPYAIGYGLTETAPLLAGFGPQNQTFKSVGNPLPGLELKIHDPDPETGEGEIIARGPNIMKGYYQNREQTEEVFTSDGYFRTGDLGYIDKKGIVYIRGRLKNMILGPNGENIYPEEIEALINETDYINESLVMQYKGKLVARVHLNVELLEQKFHDLKSNAQDFQHQLQHKAEGLTDDLMNHINQHVSSNSRLQMIIIQSDPFEKTPTQKIKRFLYQQI